MKRSLGNMVNPRLLFVIVNAISDTFYQVCRGSIHHIYHIFITYYNSALHLGIGQSNALYMLPHGHGDSTTQSIFFIFCTRITSKNVKGTSTTKTNESWGPALFLGNLNTCRTSRQGALTQFPGSKYI